MSRKPEYNSDPIRAPLEQPPLFYRDGRPTTDEERGIVKPPDPDPAPESLLRDPFAGRRPTPLLPVVLLGIAAAVGVVALITLRFSVIGLALAFGTFGALAKLR